MINGYMILGIVIILLILSGIRIINEYERGVKFTLGRFTGIMGPGLNIIIPIVQTFQKVDMRVRVVDVPDQESITKDNITVSINAVIYYKVADAEKAIIQVEDYDYAVSQLAQTTMRNIVGEVELDELLSSREKIAKKIEDIIEKATTAWGIDVNAVELKDIKLAQEMKRVIAKQAEAEREKRAVIIESEGELIASDNMSKAAKVLSVNPASIHLRTLQTLRDLSSDQSNTVVFAVPIEMMSLLKAFNEKK